MLVCDVSAIDRLIDMYGENFSVLYKSNSFVLSDLRDEFVDNNIECSLNNYLPSSQGIRHRYGEEFVISINPHQAYDRDDIIGL
jgi:hypothetical protein